MGSSISNGEIMVGWASKEITPAVSAALVGQFYERVAEHVRDPLWLRHWHWKQETGMRPVNNAS